MDEYNLCLNHAYRLTELVADTYLDEKCDCMLLSGGVDTGFIALSLVLHGIKPRTITVVYDDESPDYHYARLVAGKLRLDNTIVFGKEFTKECLGRVLEVFRTIDPIETVCDIPLCIGLIEALEKNCKCVITGDGGDELFFGYSFLLNKSERELLEWVKRVIDKRFSSETLGEALGVRVVPAFYSNKIKEYSWKIPFKCRITRLNGRIWGKFLLRVLLDKHGLNEIAWREKTPVNLGSGFNKLLREWSLSIPFNTVMKLYPRSLIHFPSKPHAYLYIELTRRSISVPEKCGTIGKACPICGRCLVDDHCSFCGASITRSGVSVYSDETYHALRRVMSS